MKQADSWFKWKLKARIWAIWDLIFLLILFRVEGDLRVFAWQVVETVEFYMAQNMNDLIDCFIASAALECLHICWLSSSREAKESIGEWMRDYNQDRLHQSLEYQTPDSVYLNSEPKKEMAA